MDSERGRGPAAGRVPLLDVQRLRKAFGGVTAVSDLSFRVARGEIFGLLGPNGSGKTTVFSLVAGTLRADAGAIFFDGRAITHLSLHGRSARGIARTYQHVRCLPHLSAVDNVTVARLYGARPAAPARARPEAAALLERVGLAWARDLPAGGLTVAKRKRLEVARALATHPSLLLLDEPLAGLNPPEAADALALFGRIRDDGVTIMIVEHNVGAIRQLCGRVMVMNSGQKIAEGEPEAVLVDERVIEVYLGERPAAAATATRRQEAP